MNGRGKPTTLLGPRAPAQPCRGKKSGQEAKGKCHGSSPRPPTGPRRPGTAGLGDAREGLTWRCSSAPLRHPRCPTAQRDL